MGGSDQTTHPWLSRRMHRMLLSEGISSKLEEISGQQHWWWDTVTENDGGVLNDYNMRKFYSQCYQKSLFRRYYDILRLKEIQQTQSGVTDNNNIATGNSTSENNTDDAGKRNIIDNIKDSRFERCKDEFTLTVLVPPLHKKLCGFQIQQQFLSMSRSSVHVSCSSSILVNPDKSETVQKKCSISTGNVRRLRISLGSGFFARNSAIVVDGLSISDLWETTALFSNTHSDRSASTSRAQTHKASKLINAADEMYVDICWYSGCESSTSSSSAYDEYVKKPSSPSVCCKLANPLYEKTLSVYGPVQQVYSRPLLVVYGTPQDQYYRKILKDTAVHIANSLFAAHSSHVEVVTDMQYKSIVTSSEDMYETSYVNDGDENEGIFMNSIFIGGPMHNKAIRSMIQHKIQPIQANVQNVVYKSVSNGSSAYREENPIFCIGERYCFSNSDNAVIYTFPMISGSSASPSGSALGVCIHANSVEGYLHFSRISWPTVPPMVRAPFANYIPDYMVIDSMVWSQGLGGVLMAGFWAPNWAFSVFQYYSNPNPKS